MASQYHPIFERNIDVRETPETTPERTIEPAYENRFERRRRLESEIAIASKNLAIATSKLSFNGDRQAIANYLAPIAELAKIRKDVDETLKIAVQLARTIEKPGGYYGGGAKWADIGQALGTTGQAANAKYGRKR